MLEFFEIEGLFGIKKIRIPFLSELPKIKIIVGNNGSYKTTITKLLYAVLSKDFNQVRNISFSKLRVKFVHLEVIELDRKDIFPENDYKEFIKKSSFYKELIDNTRYNSGMILELINDVYSETNNAISLNLLADIINEINRPIILDLQRELDHNINFYKLKSKKDEIKRKEKYLGSLKNIPNFNLLFLPTYRRLELVVSREKQEKINSILDSSIFFGMSDVKNDFTSISRRIRDLWLEEFLSNESPQSKAILSNIEDTQTKRKSLQDDVEKFISVCNKYLTNKELRSDVRGAISLEILGESNNNSKLDLNFLSSGEKQIVSLFAKLYLKGNEDTQDKYYLFIDEPEISLSIEWQEMLLSDILDSNKCDFLFVATHSPFIFKKGLINYTVDVNDYIIKED